MANEITDIFGQEGFQPRLARVLMLADEYLGDRSKSIHWMKTPNAVFGGAAPLALLDTEIGAHRVEEVLGRIAYGGIS